MQIDEPIKSLVVRRKLAIALPSLDAIITRRFTTKAVKNSLFVDYDRFNAGLSTALVKKIIYFSISWLQNVFTTTALKTNL